MLDALSRDTLVVKWCTICNNAEATERIRVVIPPDTHPVQVPACIQCVIDIPKSEDFKVNKFKEFRHDN